MGFSRAGWRSRGAARWLQRILMQAVPSAGLWNNAITDNQACPNFNLVSPVTSPNGSGQCIHSSASVTSSLKLEKQWLASCRCCNDYRWCRGCYYISASWYCCSFLQILIKKIVKCHRIQVQKGMAEKRNSRYWDNSSINTQFPCSLMIFLGTKLGPRRNRDWFGKGRGHKKKMRKGTAEIFMFHLFSLSFILLFLA